MSPRLTREPRTCRSLRNFDAVTNKKKDVTMISPYNYSL